jgi:hypothetical protein
MRSELGKHGEFRRHQCERSQLQTGIRAAVARATKQAEASGGNKMRKLLLSFAAASAVMTALVLAPAQAMTVGTASRLQAALADTILLEEARYVCHHRFYTSRRVCWWRPGPYRKWRWRPWRRW